MNRSRLLPLVLAPLLLVTGCSGGTSSDSVAGVAQDRSVDGEAPAAPTGAEGATPGGGTGGGGTGSGTTTAAITSAALTDGRDLVRTATLQVQVDDVERALGLVAGAAAARGGFVATTRAYTPPGSPASATLVLRVPGDAFEPLLADLAGLGDVLDRTAETVDVTEEVVDVTSRVATAQAALARVRALLDRAVTIADVVALEGELTVRQSDLESLLARQRSLADRTTLSTVSVDLLGPEGRDEPDEGFLAGLRSGWDAFTGSATALLTATGAVLPFAGLLALLGLGTLALRRTRRRTSPAPAPLQP